MNLFAFTGHGSSISDATVLIRYQDQLNGYQYMKPNQTFTLKPQQYIIMLKEPVELQDKAPYQDILWASIMKSIDALDFVKNIQKIKAFGSEIFGFFGNDRVDNQCPNLILDTSACLLSHMESPYRLRCGLFTVPIKINHDLLKKTTDQIKNKYLANERYLLEKTKVITTTNMDAIKNPIYGNNALIGYRNDDQYNIIEETNIGGLSFPMPMHVSQDDLESLVDRLNQNNIGQFIIFLFVCRCGDISDSAMRLFPRNLDQLEKILLPVKLNPNAEPFVMKGGDDQYRHLYMKYKHRYLQLKDKLV